MSLSGIIIVLIVSIFVIKPEDIEVIIRKARLLVEYALDLKREITSHLNIDIITNEVQQHKSIDHYAHDANCNTKDEIEFYLQKIININGHYEGDYTLEQVKSQYYKLVQLKIQQESNIQRLK
jgi:hypothetical protein